MLDHEDRVAHIAQPLQCRKEPSVVPLVKADGRLVEYVQDPYERAAYLGSKPYPLPLSTGKGGRWPVQRYVVEPDICEEVEPLADFF